MTLTAAETLPDNKLFAAVDIGSNSIHMMIARISKGALQPIQAYRERVQLAAGLSPERILSEDAIERGVECLQRMGKVLSDYALDQVRVVATHTIRVARNRNDFISLAEQALGYSVDVISGSEEARIIYQGVAHSRTLDTQAMIIDIGGGSTEIAVGVGFEPSAVVSCPMGCVSYRDRFFKDSVGKKQFKNARLAALQRVDACMPALKKQSWHKVFATSGTAKALERIVAYMSDESLADPALRRVIPLKTLKQIEQKIVKDGLKFLEEQALGENRVPLVPGGLSILITVMEALDIDELRYIDVALREGVLYELDEEMRFADIKQRTRKSLHARYQVDTEQAQRVVQSCDWIYRNCLSEKQQEKLFPHRVILLKAGYLHEVGLQISAGGIQRHSAYILKYSDLPGFSREEQELLAWLVGRYRKGISLEGVDEFSHIKKSELWLLLAVLRLAILFNVSRKDVDLSLVKLRIDKAISCELPQSFVEEYPLVEADLLREQGYWQSIERAFDLIIVNYNPD